MTIIKQVTVVYLKVADISEWHSLDAYDLHNDSSFYLKLLGDRLQCEMHYWRFLDWIKAQNLTRFYF